MDRFKPYRFLALRKSAPSRRSASFFLIVFAPALLAVSGCVAGAILIGTHLAGTPTATATIKSISATGVDGPLGTVSFMDSAKGMVITPRLSGLPPRSARVSYS